MMPGRVLMAGWLALLLAVVLLAGCAGKAPQTVALERGERERVGAAFTAFSGQECPLSLDADVTLEMQLLGKSEKSAGMLQYQGPSSFRYAMVDPLGRSLFIMVTDGYTFTMVYNREAKAVTGSTTSRYWQDYVPQGVSADDMLLLLAGRPPATLRLTDIRGDREGTGSWLYGTGAEGLRHEILFDPQPPRLLRHILRDGRGKILFDVRYDRYGEGDPLCPQPHDLRIEGKTITGTIALRLDRVFAGQAIPAQTFRINPPGHFLIQEVE